MSIKSKIIASYILLITIIISFFGAIILISLEKYYITNMTYILESQGATFSHVFDSYIDADIYTIGQDVAKKLSKDINAKVQVLNIEGLLLGDSSVNAKPYPLKINTPDVSAAIKGNTGTYIGSEYGEKILNVSVPIKNSLNYVAVLRLSTSLNNVSDLVRKVSYIIVGVLLASILLSYLIGIVFAARLTKPLNMVKDATIKMAKGNFNVRAKKITNDEIGMLADSFNKMAEELSQLDNIKNEFISNISHELRTPLTSIKGFAVTALDDIDKDNSLFEYLSIINSEADRLTSLVEELLDFSRIQSNKLKISYQKFDIVNLIRETISMLKPAINRAGINIKYSGPENYIINGDKDRIKQVLVNLIDNSAKASQCGNNINIVLNISNKVMIRVIDEGSGIPCDELSKIFEKFYRSKNSRYSGTGLGLSIVKGIIEAHKGEINVESEVGKGTTFTITLPKD